MKFAYIRMLGCVFLLFSLFSIFQGDVYTGNGWKYCSGIAWGDTKITDTSTNNTTEQQRWVNQKIIEQNTAGTVYGSKKKLKTIDTSAPQGTIVINGGDAYTNSPKVQVSLLATDDEGITGYYFSTNNVIPSATAEGWTNITPSPAYGAGVSYTLSSGDERKTLYVWFKDAAGNISNTVTDSIDLDTTAPVVVITSPVSGDTYSTTAVLINLGGSASDSGSGISHVAWSTDKGGRDLASGAANWKVAGVSLESGNTVVTVKATDGAGNTGSDTLTISVSATGLTNGLKAFYNFNEGSGATAFDTSGYANNGITSGATGTTGIVGGALKFNGVDNYVSIPRMNYDEISISAWFYKNAKDTANVDAIIGGWKWDLAIETEEGFDLRFSPTTPDTLEFVLVTKNASGTRVLKTAKANLVNSVGSWFHAVGVYNKNTGEQKLSINGQLVNTQFHPAGNTIVPMTIYADIKIGYSRVNKGFFNGTIDEVHFYNRALSSQEVLDLYNIQ
ncbi:MAG: LamG domain-containing protein [Candidatus Brocadiaceae bacterium]